MYLGTTVNYRLILNNKFMRQPKWLGNRNILFLSGLHSLENCDRIRKLLRYVVTSSNIGMSKNPTSGQMGHSIFKF